MQQVLGMPAAKYQNLRPIEADISGFARMGFRLWQLGRTTMSRKGGPSLYAVRDNIQKMVVGFGSET